MKIGNRVNCVVDVIFGVMSDHQPQRLPANPPTLESVHQLAFERAIALNLLLENSMDRQNSLRRRILQLDGRMEALLDDIQMLKQRWRVK